MNRAHEHKSITGTRTRMTTRDVPAGAEMIPTQLISARVDKPRQFVVTIAQATQPNGVAPWVSTLDGGNVFPAAPPAILTAPLNTEALKLELRWGAGGTAFVAQFDYPAVGGAFGVTADQLDLNAIIGNPAYAVVLDPKDVPVVGAFMVEGPAADATPLRWRELYPAVPAFTTVYAVKNYARALRLSQNVAGAAQAFDIEWRTASNTLLRTDRMLATEFDKVLTVPAMACVVIISSLAVNPPWAEWLLGFV